MGVFLRHMSAIGLSETLHHFNVRAKGKPLLSTPLCPDIDLCVHLSKEETGLVETTRYVDIPDTAPFGPPQCYFQPGPGDIRHKGLCAGVVRAGGILVFETPAQ